MGKVGETILDVEEPGTGLGRCGVRQWEAVGGRGGGMGEKESGGGRGGGMGEKESGRGRGGGEGERMSGEGDGEGIGGRGGDCEGRIVGRGCEACDIWTTSTASLVWGSKFFCSRMYVSHA